MLNNSVYTPSHATIDVASFLDLSQFDSVVDFTICGLVCLQAETSGYSSSSVSPISNAPIDFNAPTEPP